MAHIIEPDHRAHAARGPGLSYQLGAKLLGQPLAMRMAAANRLKAAIEAREFDSSVQVALPGLSKFAGTVDQRSRFRVTDDGVAIVPVGGLLIDRGGWLGDLGGFATSYEGLEEQIRRIEKDSAIKSVVLDIDSPGGMVAGIFDVCGLLTRLKKSRKVYALAANMADSAAYAIACVAHEVHVTRTGEVGSIGVIQYHQSYARALDASGIDTTIIFEGERKPDGNPFQQLSHGARSDMAADSADICFAVNASRSSAASTSNSARLSLLRLTGESPDTAVAVMASILVVLRLLSCVDLIAAAWVDVRASMSEVCASRNADCESFAISAAGNPEKIDVIASLPPRASPHARMTSRRGRRQPGGTIALNPQVESGGLSNTGRPCRCEAPR